MRAEDMFEAPAAKENKSNDVSSILLAAQQVSQDANKKINEALISTRESAVAAYVLGESLHEAWRKGKKREDETFKPSWRGVNGEKELIDVTPEQAVAMGFSKNSVVDIANTPFDKLPPKWQGENLEAGRFAAKYYIPLKENPELIKDEKWVHDASAAIHDAWSKRNSWSDLAKMNFDELSPEEQQKDTDQLFAVNNIVNDFASKELNLEALEEKFRLGGGEINKEVTVRG